MLTQFEFRAKSTTVEYSINHSNDVSEGNVHVHIVHAYVHLSRKHLHYKLYSI